MTLSTRVEQAGDGSFVLDCEIAQAVGSGCVNPPRAYTASLGDAWSLIPPDHFWHVGTNGDGSFAACCQTGGEDDEARSLEWTNAAQASLALCAAALKARGL